MRQTTLVRAQCSVPGARRSARLAGVARGSQSQRDGLIHRLILGLVFVTMVLSSIVFTEPAPVDALLAGLTVLLPLVGLVAVTPALSAYIALWTIAGACGLIAATLSRDVAASSVFTSVSLYLYVASFMLAAFVARAPVRHCRLLLTGWLVAALLAAAAGLAGYFNVLAGAHELFTKFERASGPFKDPNVFGPFLVAPFIYALHLLLGRPLTRGLLPLAAMGVLALGVLLSFSRGAWINLVVATAI